MTISIQLFDGMSKIRPFSYPQRVTRFEKERTASKTGEKRTLTVVFFPIFLIDQSMFHFFSYTKKKLKKEEEEKDRPQCLTMDVSVKAQETFVFTSDERKCLDPYTHNTHTRI